MQLGALTPAAYSYTAKPVVPSASAEGEADEDSTQASALSQQKHTTTERARDEQQAKLLEQAEITDLARRDREVRAHEQAHAAVGGAHAGAPTYTYERGPDGKKYVTSGEVSISTSAVPGDPQATIAKMQQVRNAALAPAQPSAQDRRVAAQALAALIQAQAELAAQNPTERTEPKGEESESASALEQYRQVANAGQEEVAPVDIYA